MQRMNTKRTGVNENIARRTRGTGWFRNSLWRGFTKLLAGKGFSGSLGDGMVGFFIYIHPSAWRLAVLGSQIWVSTCVLFCLRLFLSLFPFAYVLLLGKIWDLNIFFLYHCHRLFPLLFFSCLHHFLLISPSGSTFISPILLLPPRAIVW